MPGLSPRAPHNKEVETFGARHRTPHKAGAPVKFLDPHQLPQQPPAQAEAAKPRHKRVRQLVYALAKPLQFSFIYHVLTPFRRVSFTFVNKVFTQYVAFHLSV